jgi:hypothetical protein
VGKFGGRSGDWGLVREPETIGSAFEAGSSGGMAERWGGVVGAWEQAFRGDRVRLQGTKVTEGVLKGRRMR